MRCGTLGAAMGCSAAWWGEVEVRRRLARSSFTPRCWRLGDSVVLLVGEGEEGPGREEGTRMEAGWRIEGQGVAWDVRELGALEPMDAGGVDCGLLKFLKCRFLGILPAEWLAFVDEVAGGAECAL